MQDATAILAGLTDPQREAVSHIQGPLLVVAGAGSGKTRVITRRVAHLCLNGVAPYRIVAVTFTNKAAGEMRERIEKLSGTRGVWVLTFHALCARLLRMSAGDVGLDRNFTIYDRNDQLNTVKEGIQRLDLDASVLKPASVLHAISEAKSNLLSPEQFAQRCVVFRDELVAKVYAKYQALLDSNAALDFDDLLMKVALLLDGDAAFRERWQQRFDFVLIDEYQDTNHAQYRIARTLAASHRNLCATGDADQSIYGWRGANIRNILNFTKDYADARVVKLEQNFRSTRTILQGANSVIEKNSLRHERGMWTENEQGEPVRFLLGADADDEADLVVEGIQARHQAGRRWGDCAVFYRTNAQSRSIEEALVQASVAYRIVGAVEFYSRQEIKDLVAYLRVCVNERDDLSLGRIINRPTRGIGQQTLERLKQWAESHGVSLWAAVTGVEEIEGLGPRGRNARARNAVTTFRETIEDLRGSLELPVAEFCAKVLKTSGYSDWLGAPENEERRQNVAELLAKAEAFDQMRDEPSVADFLQEVSLVSDVDNLEGDADAVTLMTLHAAKGLEFPVVFLTGMEEGLLPHANSSDDDDKVEEERRLCYVGMTRAQKELILTAARERVQYTRGDGADAGWGRTPSRFLAEIAREAFDGEALGELGEFQSGDSSVDDGPRHWRGRPSQKGWWQAAPAEPEPAASPPRPKPAAPPRPKKGHGLVVGDWIMHPKLGKGRIVSLQASERMTLATVSMFSGGKRVFSLEHAGLEKLNP